MKSITTLLLLSLTISLCYGQTTFISLILDPLTPADQTVPVNAICNFGYTLTVESPDTPQLEFSTSTSGVQGTIEALNSTVQGTYVYAVKITTSNNITDFNNFIISGVEIPDGSITALTCLEVDSVYAVSVEVESSEQTAQDGKCVFDLVLTYALSGANPPTVTPQNITVTGIDNSLYTVSVSGTSFAFDIRITTDVEIFDDVAINFNGTAIAGFNTQVSIDSLECNVAPAVELASLTFVNEEVQNLDTLCAYNLTASFNLIGGANAPSSDDLTITNANDEPVTITVSDPKIVENVASYIITFNLGAVMEYSGFILYNDGNSVSGVDTVPFPDLTCFEKNFTAKTITFDVNSVQIASGKCVYQGLFTVEALEADKPITSSLSFTSANRAVSSSEFTEVGAVVGTDNNWTYNFTLTATAAGTYANDIFTISYFTLDVAGAETDIEIPSVRCNAPPSPGTSTTTTTGDDSVNNANSNSTFAALTLSLILSSLFFF